MKVYVVYNVLTDWTSGCIIVSAKNKEEAIKIIKENRDELYGDEVDWSNLEEHLEEVTEGYYGEVFGGG